MFPIGDDNSARRSMPVVTVVLIALNVLFFFVELNGGDAFIRQWAFIPAAVRPGPCRQRAHHLLRHVHARRLAAPGRQHALPVDFRRQRRGRFGPVKFLIFYLVCGVAATFAQYFVVPNSRIPNVGASGAIAGVLGAYLVMFPHARVRVLIYNQIVALPALMVLGILDRAAGVQRRRVDCADSANRRDRRRRLHGPCRRFRCRLGAGVGFTRKQPTAGRLRRAVRPWRIRRSACRSARSQAA